MSPSPPISAYSSVFDRRRFVSFCVLIAAGCAVTALAGWIFDLPALRSIVSGFPEMKPITAVAFLLAVVGLFFAVRKPGLKAVPVAAGCVITLIAVYVLLAYLLGSTAIPVTRMSPHSATNFMLVGLSLTLMTGREKLSRVSAILGVLSFFVTYAAILGHLYEAERLYGSSSANSVSLPTILSFLAIASGLIFANPRSKIAELFISKSLGGQAVRRLLPAVIVVPTLAGWLWQFGLESGYYDAGFEMAMAIFSLVVVTFAIVYYYGQTVHESDELRRRVESELADKENQYRELFDYSQGLICIHDLEGRLITVNRATLTLLGYTHEELVGLNMRALLRLDDWPMFDAYLRQINNEGLANGLLELMTKKGEALMVRYYNVLVAETGKDPYVLGHAQNVSELLAAQAELRNLSLTDELTGLNNRRGFLTLAEQQLKLERHSGTARGLTLMFADLDGLKQINDTHGHEAGSDAITMFAQLVKSVVREADLVARWGGDEFVILSIGSHDDNAEQMIDRIQARIAEHNGVTDKPYAIACSIGVAPLRVDDDRSIDCIIAEADEAMYAEKKRRKSSRDSLPGPLPNIPPPSTADSGAYVR